MIDWQPIETAPRDTEILVTGINSSGGRYVGLVKLIESAFMMFDPVADDFIHESGPHTHWMPLPPPPAEGQEP